MGWWVDAAVNNHAAASNSSDVGYAQNASKARTRHAQQNGRKRRSEEKGKDNLLLRALRHGLHCSDMF